MNQRLTKRRRALLERVVIEANGLLWSAALIVSLGLDQDELQDPLNKLLVAVEELEAAGWVIPDTEAA